MEKRSRRRIRDLVALSASQGLSQNEIGCARISMMARSTNASFTGRIQKRKTYPLHYSHPACNTRPVHTKVPDSINRRCRLYVRISPKAEVGRFINTPEFGKRRRVEVEIRADRAQALDDAAGDGVVAGIARTGEARRARLEDPSSYPTKPQVCAPRNRDYRRCEHRERRHDHGASFRLTAPSARSPSFQAVLYDESRCERSGRG